MNNRFYIVKGRDDISDIFIKLEKYIDDLDSNIVQIVVTKGRKGRTNRQNAYLWAVVYPILLPQFNRLGWEFTSIDEVHEWCLNKFCSKEYINKHTGEVVYLRDISSSRMNTLEFMTYIDNISDFAIEFLDTEIPAPTLDYWKGKE